MHGTSTDADGWLELPTPIRVSLLRPGKMWFFVPYFSRYVGWSLAGDLTSSAEVSVDIVGKSG